MRTYPISLTFILLLGVWLNAVAGPPEGMQGMRMHENMMKELNLTSDQQFKLKSLRLDFEKAKLPYEPKMKALRDKAKAELLKPSPQKQVLDGYASELAKIHEQLEKERIAHLLKVKEVLKPDQFEKLLNMDMRHKGMDKEKGEEHEKHMEE